MYAEIAIQAIDSVDEELTNGEVFINGWNKLSIKIGDNLYYISMGVIYELIIKNFLNDKMGAHIAEGKQRLSERQKANLLGKDL